MNPEIVLILHDIRSCHNVGSLLRTAEGLGVNKVYFTGYTPYPQKERDSRLPHLAVKITSQISKTALGAEKLVLWDTHSDVEQLIAELKESGIHIIALEQTSDATPLPTYTPANKIAVVLGREVEGIESSILKLADTTVVIPMYGKKESFNVVQAAAMCLYHCRFR